MPKNDGKNREGDGRKGGTELPLPENLLATSSADAAERPRHDAEAT